MGCHNPFIYPVKIKNPVSVSHRTIDIRRYHQQMRNNSFRAEPPL